MSGYWERRREIEEKEANEKELNKIVKLSWDEEANEYDKLRGKDER